MNKLPQLFKSKVIIFIIQIALFSLFIFIFNYRASITFDADILQERSAIIQFFANYVIFSIEENGIFGIFFIFFSWTLISLFPIIIYKNYKKAWSMNLTTFFFPNFFFYVFYARYSQRNFDLVFSTYFLQTILLAFYIIGLSIGVSLILKNIFKEDQEIQVSNLKEVEAKAGSKCPYCGTEFDSIPKYCYKCSKEIHPDNNEVK